MRQTSKLNSRYDTFRELHKFAKLWIFSFSHAHLEHSRLHFALRNLRNSTFVLNSRIHSARAAHANAKIIADGNCLLMQIIGFVLVGKEHGLLKTENHIKKRNCISFHKLHQYIIFSRHFIAHDISCTGVQSNLPD